MTSRIVYGSRESRPARRMPHISLTAALIGGAVMAGVIGTVVAVMLPALQLKDIAVSGLETLDEHAVREKIAQGLAGSRFLLVPRSSYFLANTSVLAEDLRRAFPAISSISAKKTFPHTLAIAVTERRFWGIMCNDLQSESEAEAPRTAPSHCVALDTTGFGYESSPRPQGNLILIVETDRAILNAGEQQIELTLMDRLEILRGGIQEATGQEVTRFALRERSPSEIRARSADGFAIYFRRDDDFVNAFRVLKKVLDAEIGNRRDELAYIDVRFGNKVFYKFK